MKAFIAELNRDKKPIVLTQNGKSAAVLIDAEQYQELLDQIEFMRKIANGLDDMKHGRTSTLSEIMKEAESFLHSNP